MILAGGTFDVSVIHMTQQDHEVIASEGISRLGGDDLDEALLELALAHPELAGSAMDWISRSRLLNLCREAKENINPNTRKITIDLGQISVRGRRADDWSPELLREMSATGATDD